MVSANRQSWWRKVQSSRSGTGSGSVRRTTSNLQVEMECPGSRCSALGCLSDLATALTSKDRCRASVDAACAAFSAEVERQEEDEDYLCPDHQCPSTYFY